MISDLVLDAEDMEEGEYDIGTGGDEKQSDYDRKQSEQSAHDDVSQISGEMSVNEYESRRMKRPKQGFCC